MEKKSLGKRIIKIVLLALLAVILVVGSYFAYVLISYERIDEETELVIDNKDNNELTEIKIGEKYSILTNNIGYGALQQDYSFFMDGGKYSVGFSEEAVSTAINEIVKNVSSFSCDFMLFQEMDLDAKRSYHMDQYEIFKKYINERAAYSSDFAVNYDCPYLFYPISEPIGKSVSGIATFSRANIKSAKRYSLPIEEGFKKLIDLDRCFAVSRVDVGNGKELCLINLHLSAFTGEGSTVRTRQVEQLCKLIGEEYKKGNYIICGGDFNHDLLGDSTKFFPYEGEKVEWAQPFPIELLPKGFSVKAASNSPTCRNLEKEYTPGEQFVTVIDGFIVSDNIECLSIQNVDNQFKYSDHNPVIMEFILNE